MHTIPHTPKHLTVKLLLQMVHATRNHTINQHEQPKTYREPAQNLIKIILLQNRFASNAKTKPSSITICSAAFQLTSRTFHNHKSHPPTPESHGPGNPRKIPTRNARNCSPLLSAAHPKVLTPCVRHRQCKNAPLIIPFTGSNPTFYISPHNIVAYTHSHIHPFRYKSTALLARTVRDSAHKTVCPAFEGGRVADALSDDVSSPMLRTTISPMKFNKI